MQDLMVESCLLGGCGSHASCRVQGLVSKAQGLGFRVEGSRV